jgi:SOUL heme-binding protein
VQSVIHKVTVVLAGIGQVVGIRSSIEESRYSVEAKFGEIEIRRYDERLAAETEVDGASETARAVGFRRIAGYIFGGNAAKDSIAMTAPVAQDFHKKPQDSSQLITMTTPGTHRAVSAQGFDAAMVKSLVDVNLLGTVNCLSTILPDFIK